jgi:hypothetical protein
MAEDYVREVVMMGIKEDEEIPIAVYEDGRILVVIE